MGKLTTQEKARRYESLQTAIKWTLEQYKREQADANRSYESGVWPESIRAYNKGRADAMSSFVATLERWLD